MTEIFDVMSEAFVIYVESDDEVQYLIDPIIYSERPHLVERMEKAAQAKCDALMEARSRDIN